MVASPRVVRLPGLIADSTASSRANRPCSASTTAAESPGTLLAPGHHPSLSSLCLGCESVDAHDELPPIGEIDIVRTAGQRRFGHAIVALLERAGRVDDEVGPQPLQVANQAVRLHVDFCRGDRGACAPVAERGGERVGRGRVAAGQYQLEGRILRERGRDVLPELPVGTDDENAEARHGPMIAHPAVCR